MHLSPDPTDEMDDGLNRYGPYRLGCWNAWSIGRGTIGMCGLIEVGVVLLEKVCYCKGEL